LAFCQLSGKIEVRLVALSVKSGSSSRNWSYTVMKLFLILLEIGLFVFCRNIIN